MTLLNEIEPVLRSGTCVGCGICAAFAPSAIAIRRNANGACQAVFTNPEQAAEIAGGLCPFSSASADEDAHAEVLFGPDCQVAPLIGRFRGIWAGHAETGSFRQQGSSGGITSLLMAQALEQNVVDMVVHVGEAHGSGELFEYTVSRSAEDVQRGAKTRYYSVSMAAALQEAMAADQRIALVGVPCFVKAARNLARRDAKFSDQLILTASIFCGHMKSSLFAESLAWQAGVRPEDIRTVDFRTKLPRQEASKYGFTVTSRSGAKTELPMRKLLGRRWDCGFFRLKACDYCDDVVGETADISLGDAWIPGYASDWRGHNIVITRSGLADQMFRSFIDKGYVTAQPLSCEEVVQSQGGGFRDRREGLSYRLYLDDRKGRWRPEKRVCADNEHLSTYRKIVYRLRRILRERSFAAFRLSKSWETLYPFRLEMSVWNLMLAVIAQSPSVARRILGRTRLGPR